MRETFKYFAFISFSSKDMRQGQLLQRKLEHFRLPATLCSQRGWKRQPMRPIFFAPTDIQPGDLNEELKQRLRQSKNLIVICSPNSANSPWVGKEIEYFHELGRDRNIHFFIVDGIPNSGDPATECFNPIVKKLGIPEILGANIHEKIYQLPWLNRERAYIQLISKLLGLEFDSLWQRHRRALIAKAGYGLTAVVALIAIIYLFAIPLRLTVDVRLLESQLPVGEETVLRMNEAEYVARTENISFPTLILPGYKRFSEITISAGSEYFEPTDTVITFGLSHKKHIDIVLERDSTFAIYGGYVYNEDLTPIEGVTVQVATASDSTNASGYFHIQLPLDKQLEEQEICLMKEGYITIDRKDETPGRNLKFIMHNE